MRISFQHLEYLGQQCICNNYNKNFFFFRFLVKFFTLSSFKHSAFQDLRRYSRVPAFTIWGVPSAYSIVVCGRN